MLHIMGDALGSVVVILTALIIKYGKAMGDARFYFDPIASILITVFIGYHTIPFVKACCYIILQRAPEWLDVTALKAEVNDPPWYFLNLFDWQSSDSNLIACLLLVQILSQPGVVGCHELHVWQIDPSRVLCTAHISVPQGSDLRQVLHAVHTLLHARGLHSSTIQPELVPAITGATQLEYMCSDILCADQKCAAKGCCA